MFRGVKSSAASRASCEKRNKRAGRSLQLIFITSTPTFSRRMKVFYSLRTARPPAAASRLFDQGGEHVC